MNISQKIIGIALAFLSMNKGLRPNATNLVKEAMDIVLAIHKIASTKSFSQADKDALAEEVKEFNDAVEKFLEDITIPD